jgi:hypothetical protein
VKAFLAAYEGEAKLNATEAARLAYGGKRQGSLSAPAMIARDIRRRFPDLIEAAEERFRDKFRMSDDELDTHLSEISRDKQHKDRLRALELIARMKGRLNDKLQVTIDRKSMLKEIESLLVVIPNTPRELLSGSAKRGLKAIN